MSDVMFQISIPSDKVLVTNRVDRVWKERYNEEKE